MTPVYKVHPGIGIARLGNSPDGWCISPEAPAALPIECDDQGNPRLTVDGTDVRRVTQFKDGEGRIKRQAARFQIYVYDQDHPEGRPLKIGDRIAGGGNEGTLVDIQWRVYLANKKASWYTFEQLQGEHGYAPDHPRRNADVTGDEARQRLIIDPGPRGVNTTDRRRARIGREDPNYAPTFPPPLDPVDIDTLGDLRTDDEGRLLVLGGHGHSGSYQTDGYGQPLIESYANNDGWFDDTSDGPVTARLVMYAENVTSLRYVDVEYPAWCVVGYPAYVPEILDMITMDEVVHDMGVRAFATRPDLFGPPGSFDDPPCIDPTDTKALVHWRAGALAWNPDHKPWFYRDVWPILFRADEFSYLTDVLSQSNFPHNQTGRGNFDPERLGVPPVINRRAVAACEATCIERNASGELFLDAVDPSLTLVDSELNAGLRQTLDQFDQAVQTKIAAATSVGDGPTEREVARYNAWLASVRTGFSDTVGTLLFEDLRDAVRGTTPGTGEGLKARAEAAGLFRAFAATVEGEAAGESAAALAEADPKALGEGTPDRPPAPRLDVYTRRWRAETAANSGAVRDAERALEDDLGALVDRLHARAAADWDRRVGEADALFAGWGGPFPGFLDGLRAFGATSGADLSPLTLLFERMRAYVLKQLQAFVAGKLLEQGKRACVAAHTYDPFARGREYLYALLRQPSQENKFRRGGRPEDRLYKLPLMPLLSGDNPISNDLPSKFLRLTDTQLYVLRQWADGHFYNEKMEGWADPDPYLPYAGWTNATGADLDRGVLTNVLGGAFCPGGEVGWIQRNPSAFREPYRIKADPAFASFRETAAQASARSTPPQDFASASGGALSQDNDFDTGLQPGDLTKYMALPWQADFNECSSQTIDITYEEWNVLYPDSDGDSLMERQRQAWETLWWPAHRPMQTIEITGWTGNAPSYAWMDWAQGIPQTNAGDQKMALAWSHLGFVVRNPYLTPAQIDGPSPDNKYITIERTPADS